MGLLKEIKAGASFEKLAKENSDDPGSSKVGGNLGYFSHGILGPDFDKAAFSLQEGRISKPVLTSFGYHLIKVEAIRAQELKKVKFEDVREDLTREFQKTVAERK